MTEQASWEKRNLSQEPCAGKVNSKRSWVERCPRLWISLEACGMIVEDHLDRGKDRIGRVERL
jgi:hypothetical protein